MKTKIIFWVAYVAIILFLANLMPKMESKPQKVGVKTTTYELIYRFEGASKTAYQDSAGNWTIGVGHLIRDSETHYL